MTARHTASKAAEAEASKTAAAAASALERSSSNASTSSQASSSEKQGPSKTKNAASPTKSPTKNQRKCPAPDIDFTNKVLLPLKKKPRDAKTDGSKTEEARVLTRKPQGTAPRAYAWSTIINKDTLVGFMCNPFSWWQVGADPKYYDAISDGLKVHWRTVMPWMMPDSTFGDILVDFINLMQKKNTPHMTLRQCKECDDEIRNDPDRIFAVWPDTNVTPQRRDPEDTETGGEEDRGPETPELPKGYVGGKYLRTDENWHVFGTLKIRGKGQTTWRQGMQFGADFDGNHKTLAVESVGVLMCGAKVVKKVACVRVFDTEDITNASFVPMQWMPTSDKFILPDDYEGGEYPGDVEAYATRPRILACHSPSWSTPKRMLWTTTPTTVKVTLVELLTTTTRTTGMTSRPRRPGWG